MHRGTTFEQPNPMLTGSVFFSTPVPEVHFHWNAKNLVQRVKDFFHAEPCQQELGNSGAVVALYIAFHTPPSQRS